MFEQLAPLLLITAGAALVGWLLGRLIRGPRPKAERERPRLAISAALLQDAHNRALSLHTRVRCAFDSAYFCSAELAATRGVNVDEYTHPSVELMRIGLTEIEVSPNDIHALELLANWAIHASPSLPAVSVESAFKIAARIHGKVIRALS